MYLNDNIQETLRKMQKITQDEVVYKEGDRFIVVNVISQSRRLLEVDKRLIESLMCDDKGKSKKTILKG